MAAALRPWSGSTSVSAVPLTGAGDDDGGRIMFEGNPPSPASTSRPTSAPDRSPSGSVPALPSTFSRSPSPSRSWQGGAVGVCEPGGWTSVSRSGSLGRGQAHEQEHYLGPARRLLTQALDAASAVECRRSSAPTGRCSASSRTRPTGSTRPRAHLDAALPLALDAGDRTDEAYCRQELGLLLLDTGDPELALDEFHAVPSPSPPGVGIVNLAGNGPGRDGCRTPPAWPRRRGRAVPPGRAGDPRRTRGPRQQCVDLAHLATAVALGNSSIAGRIARFLDGHPDTAAGCTGTTDRTLRAVLDATSGTPIPRRASTRPGG